MYRAIEFYNSAWKGACWILLWKYKK